MHQAPMNRRTSTRKVTSQRRIPKASRESAQNSLAKPPEQRPNKISNSLSHLLEIVWRSIATVMRKQGYWFRSLGQKARLHRDFLLVERSGLFDQDWYRSQYPDVRAAGVNPILHYLNYGWLEGRDPSATFSTREYFDYYAATKNKVSPLVHYIKFGRSKKEFAQKSSYEYWIKKFDTLTEKDRSNIRRAMGKFQQRPLISILMPVYNTELKWLIKAIDSVRNQLYPNWELCISDDASTNPEVRDVLERYAKRDARIRVTYRATNGHISINSNSALALTTGEFIALMDADDELPEHALFWVVQEINHCPDVDLIYSDEDKLDESGKRYDAYFKPDWNPSLILSQNFFCHLGVYRRTLIQRVGGFRAGFEGSQDYDLVLRCSELTEPERIRHIPRILYHWRAIPGSTASSATIEAKPYAWQAGARAIEEHLSRVGISGAVKLTGEQYYQVEYELTEYPKVSIIMLSACKLDLLRPCLQSLLSRNRTSYPNFELLLAVDETRFLVPEQAAFLKSLESDPRVRVLIYEHQPFNSSGLNNWAVGQARGPNVCFLNDDIEIITPDWLEKMVSRLRLPKVAAVGAMLYYPNDTIQHAGVILGLGGVAGHQYLNSPRGHHGYFSRALLDQDLSCVTGACLMMRREVFDSVGGFDESLSVAFNDVDLCVRIRQSGWRILWTPSVEHYHHESASLGAHNAPERAKDFEQAVHLMRRRWGAVLDSDPFYNPNLSLQSFNSELAVPPRVAIPNDLAQSTEPKRYRPGLFRTFYELISGVDGQMRSRIATGDHLLALPWKAWSIQRDAEIIAESGLFDEQWYLRRYPDVAASGRDPLIHYLAFGAAQGCDPNPLFQTQWYSARNPDVKRRGINPLLHYVLIGGIERRDPSPLFDSDWYFADKSELKTAGMNPLAHYLLHTVKNRQAPHEPRRLLQGIKVAVIIHVFYKDVWKEIVSSLRNIPIPFDLYITTPAEKAVAVRQLVLRDYPEATVIKVPNVGRDIGGFLMALPLLLKRNYIAICKLHTKKGATEPATWRHLLLRGLLGNPMLITRILQAFQSDGDLWLVGPRELYVSGPRYIHKNRENLTRFVRQVWPGRRLPRRWGFFAGTMFWIRPQALERIASAFRRIPAFEDDNTKNDGQTAHALERLFGLIATMEGKRIGLTDIIGPGPLDAVLECTPAPGAPRTDDIEEMLKVRSAEFAGEKATAPISLRTQLPAGVGE
jgi:GT2 family glycosyltransferase